MKLPDKEETIEICLFCKKQIDSEICWCGDYIKEHGFSNGHNAVPMGCICGYGKENVCPKCGNLMISHSIIGYDKNNIEMETDWEECTKCRYTITSL